MKPQLNFNIICRNDKPQGHNVLHKKVNGKKPLPVHLGPMASNVQCN